MSVSRSDSEIFIIKLWHDSDIGGRGRLRSLKMAPFDRSCTNYYWSAIASIVLFCTNFELFDVK